MRKLLLDTSLIIDYLRRKDKAETKLAKLSEVGHELSISIVTHAELYAGKSVWEDEILKETLNTLCTGFTIFSIDTITSKEAGKIRAYFQTSLVDAIIAATAIENGVELATLNRKDFENIKGLYLLPMTLQ